MPCASTFASIGIDEIAGTATVVGYAGEITDVVIPDSIIINGKSYTVTAIESTALSGCPTLTSVVIPDSVTSMGTFEYCTNLKEVTIGNGITNIPTMCFLECISIEKLTIGTGIIELGTKLFLGTNSFKTLIINSTTLPHMLYIIANTSIPTGVTIYVPAESLADYKNMPVWQGYDIQPIE